MCSGLYDKLKNIVISCSKREINRNDIDESTNLIDDLSYDSVKIIELILKIEVDFDIEFDDDDLEIDVLSNFGRLAEIIQFKLTKQA